MGKDGGVDVFIITKWVIISSGTWRLDIGQNIHIPYKIYELFIRSIYSYCTLAVVVNCIVNIGVNNARAVELLSIAISATCTTLKLFMCASKKMMVLLSIAMKDGKEIISSGDSHVRNIFSKYNKRLHILNAVIVCYTVGMSAHISAYKGFVEYRKYVETHPNTTEKPVELLVMWFPFDVQRHFNRALALQMFVMVASSVSYFSTLALCNTMMVYVIAKLKILQHYFRNFHQYPVNAEDSQPIARLKFRVMKHQDIIKFVQDLNDSMKYFLLMEYTISSVMLASVFLQILKGNRADFYIPYEIMLTFQIFILSWNASEISIESENVANALYESKWYLHSNVNIRKTMCLIIMRCRRELSLNIGPFGPNNINTALSRVKLAYSYASVMSGINLK